MKYAFKIFLLLLFTVSISELSVLHAQYLINPSCEGEVRDNIPPPAWDPCGFGSSPDTPPGIIDIFLEAQDGNTYMSLRTRAANPSLDPEWQGTLDKSATPLLIPFHANHCYSFVAALATDGEVDFYQEEEPLPTEPVKFQVYGYTDTCEDADILAETEEILNDSWADYELFIVPDLTYTGIVLQSYYLTEGNTYHGITLVDDIRIEEVDYADVVKWDTAVDFNTVIELQASGGTNYIWYDPDNRLSCTDCFNPTVTIFEDETFYVEFENNTGCTVRERFIIQSLRCTTVNTVIIMDESLNIGDTPMLEASWSPVYNWTPTINLSCEHCQTPVALIEGPVEYQCTVYDEEGCKTIERFIIRVEIVVPDVFTPNGDGYNDMFVIKNLPENSELKIFDRNGVLLFTSDNYMQEWDGRDLRGKILPTGNYWYTLAIPYIPEPWNGSIYLKRN